MKITVDVECSPEEARAFLGLPNVAPIQDAMMQQLQDRLTASMGAMDMESLMRSWFPMGLQAGVQGMEQIQKAFWAAATGAASGALSGTKSSDNKKAKE